MQSVWWEIDALNLDNYPVRTEMAGAKHIPISHVSSADDSESKYLLVDENFLKVCYMDEDESKIMIDHESSIEERESECVHKSVNKEKMQKLSIAWGTFGYGKPSCQETIYFNIFECGKNILNKIDATCKRACIATSREKYYTKIYDTLIGHNDRNNASLSNENIQDAIHKVITEEESDSHNITLDAHNVTSDTLKCKCDLDKWEAR